MCREILAGGLRAGNGSFRKRLWAETRGEWELSRETPSAPKEGLKAGVVQLTIKVTGDEPERAAEAVSCRAPQAIPSDPQWKLQRIRKQGGDMTGV